MKKIVIASSKKWLDLSSKTAEFSSLDLEYIRSREELTFENLKRIDPQYVFFPHWNWIVPKEIYESFECVVFHTAPLPYGRGGSPIQNLIARGFNTSPVCALKMTGVLDGGPIYCSFEVSLEGSCTEIFQRVAIAVKLLIVKIIRENLCPVDQIGSPTYFERRRLEENRIPSSAKLVDFYNHVRMLDSDEYPKAFLEYGNFRLEFTSSRLKDGSIEAVVRVTEL